MDWNTLWHGLGWPLCRLMFFISLGLLIGNLIEALNWTRAVARVAEPITRIAHLKDITGASFSMAFFSGVTANTMLAEAHEQGKLSDKELMISNLFNSLPTYFLHMPTLFFITVPFIGKAAAVYVGLTLCAAFLRTLFIIGLGRLALPPLEPGCVPCRLEEHASTDWNAALRKTWMRFKKRIRKITRITIPIFVAIFFLKRYGAFEALEGFLGAHVSIFSWLPAEALSIVVFHVAAEFTAGLATAGALLQGGSLGVREIVLALLLGNVLSSPMRALRHQFPYYAGIFRPKQALKLIAANQTLRVCSIIFVGVVYYFVG
ncbi:hypothetical protein [Desulfobaculum bizertense]|uniref:Nucleoside recognition n=1 Tax=Desulfobaculum bizertense DSM 18034 TaxID=1121442 RepID=A0A1T4VG61_9BACT|nr:hypothetical protein [Desulfobaculum bizertense]UIJ37765.1 hypothetical protein LWC08_13880 [Desulfobaculum bizertense]SKA63893.1 hypothetical protein SAMN02745702_00234 [Desulfobaculum bizertense DSM 18034]